MKKEKRVPKHSRKEPQRRTDVKEQEERERPSQGQGRNTKESEAGNAAIYAARGRSKETAEPRARVNEPKADEEPREETSRDYTLTKKGHRGRLENAERREAE